MAEEVSIDEREAQILAAMEIGKLNCKQKQRLNNKEVISQLIEMLHAQDNQSILTISNQAKLDIISTLHSLSTSPLTMPSILQSDCLVSLVQLIYVSDKSSELVEKAVGLLESLVSTSDIALNQVCEIGGTIGMLVEVVEEGTRPCKEHAAGVLVLICRSNKRYKAMILSEGAMPGLLQLSVDGMRRAREEAKALLLLLRDSSNATSNHSRNVLFEEVMREIERVGRVGTSIHLVEEAIAKLRP